MFCLSCTKKYLCLKDGSGVGDEWKTMWNTVKEGEGVADENATGGSSKK